MIKRIGIKTAEVATLLLGCVIAAVLLLGVEIVYALKSKL